MLLNTSQIGGLHEFGHNGVKSISEVEGQIQILLELSK